jgi:deoxyribodipyrimidine photo-lyase
MEKALDAALVWFRRDLRSVDQAALFHALKAAREVWCAFIFDRGILAALPRADRRVERPRPSYSRHACRDSMPCTRK